ncbi:zona pellucida glycoprotein 3f, tandem duplicate 2 [Ictalurus furcatus]|uniref:zona pellucida glycoprotein 3f, tandem duplicate 2 n=1 Tax=Ictalurus furcatus TaxID=66913 RepID=UPI00234FFAD9|nr:zona pellucida glycoprotein 3f, tandem duplicate 2 [Ictalurus furcatus]
MHNMLHCEVHGLPTVEEATLGSTPVSQDQGSEATVGTGSWKLGSCIHVKCGKDSAVVTWKVTESLAETPFKLETPEELIYENELIIRPLIKSDSAPVIYPIKCVTERPFPVAQPAFGVLQGQGELTFHMDLLNGKYVKFSQTEDLSGPALSNTFPLGSFINLWASVVQQGHQSLMLYLEECVASNTVALEPQSWTYPIITNKGCLVDGKTGSSRFLPRNQPSSLVLQLQTFKFATEQVYIHCKLVVWDPEDLNERNKACNYNKSIEK